MHTWCTPGAHLVHTWCKPGEQCSHGAHTQVCTKCAPGVHQDSCSPGVHQVCTRCAPGVHYLGVHHVTTVHQVCTKRAPGVHWGVHQVCTRCAELHYQNAGTSAEGSRTIRPKVKECIKSGDLKLFDWLTGQTDNSPKFAAKIAWESHDS